jgi:predicted permease
MLRKQPLFAAVAMLSLALGIGLNATIFVVVDDLIYRPLPVRDPDTVVSIYTTTEDRQPFGTTSYPDLGDLSARNTVFSAMVGHTMMFAAVGLAGQNRLAFGEIVTANYFDALGIPLAAGRGFRPNEEQGAGAHPVVVISHRLWQRSFSGDLAAVGQTLRIKNRPYTIVGVAAESFTGLMPGIAAELWIPVSMVEDIEPAGMNDVVPSASGTTRLERRGTRWLFVKGRLRDGATPATAEANLAPIMADLARVFPQSNRERAPRVVPMSAVRFHPMIDDMLRPAGAVMMVAVGLVLLVACANLASVLLARGAARTREIAVRSAMGASRGRLIWQLLVESLVLAACGGALAVLVARWATSLLTRLRLPIDLPLGFALSFDERVITFTVLLSLVTGVTFGLLPALRASRPNLVPALRDDASLASPGRRFGLRHVLVAFQVAVSTVLVVCGVLLTRSQLSAARIDPGFDANQLVVATVGLEMLGYDEGRGRQFFETAVRQLGALPGVDAVSLAERIPFSPNLQTTQIVIDGRPTATPSGGVSLDAARVSASYFDTIGVDIVDGRAFDSRDTPESPRVAVVSEAFAKRFFPGERAVGRGLRLRDQAGPLVEIVGVARDYNQRGLGETPRAVLHFAQAQRPSLSGSFLVRTSRDPWTAARDVERTLRAIDPNLVFMEMAPLEQLISMSLYPVTAGSRALGGLAGLAMLLSGIGLYGVIAFSVARRTREIGIRVALGASRARVIRQVLVEAVATVAAGGIIGVALSVAAARALSSVLYGVSPFDPVSYLGALALVLLTAAVAALIPARRAASIDPMRALRT